MADDLSPVECSSSMDNNADINTGLKNEASNDRKNHIREELSSMSFEELQELKNKIGIKLYDKAVSKNKSNTRQTTFHRENKNRPREQSSKKPVSRLREVIPVKKKALRDPRFDDLSGLYNPKIFNSTYKFIGDIKAHEKQELKKELENDTISDDRREKVKELLKRIGNQEREEKAKAIREEKDVQEKAERIEALQQGIKPRYQNKSTSNKLELVTKFNELKKGNKLDKYLVRKRKKIEQKEKRRLGK